MDAGKIIGKGVYTASDASRILKIPYSKAKYWFSYYAKNRFKSQAGKEYRFSLRRLEAINFLALMEMYIFYTLKENSVKTTKIVEAHKVIGQQLDTSYPFAVADLYLGKNKSLLFKANDNLVTADRKLQLAIEQILRPFIRKIEFTDGIATRYYPLGKNKSVVVNPENQFGQPTIEGTNILTQALYSLSKAGEPINRIAKLYDLPIKKVKEAIEFSAMAA